MKNLQCQEDFDIRTIPSDEVVENDRLEIRCQMRNISSQKLDIKVKFYCDEVLEKQLISEQEITIEATKFGFVNYFYDTKGNCGNHKIKVVVESNNEQLILNKDIKIVPHKENILSGGFISIGLPNDYPAGNSRKNIKLWAQNSVGF